jgi:SAM-dependent methyltransferase
MATSSQEQSPQPQFTYQNRARAESFGADAERYDRTRPRYPEEMIRAIVEAGPGPNVVDVGTGTGIAARQFLAAGCQVLGVEIDPRMAKLARKRGVTVEVSGFEAWDPAGRRFDLLVAGQAWHWVDPVAGAVKAASVLRPAGRVAVFWNIGRLDPDLDAAFAEVHRRVAPASDVAHEERTSGPDALAADGLRQTGLFTEPEIWRFPWDRRYTRDALLDEFLSHSNIQLLPPETRAALLAGIGEEIDRVGGSFTMHYTATVITASRLATD